MLTFVIVNRKGSAAKYKISYCDLRIFKCLNISFSRETSQPTTFFDFSLGALRTLIKTNKKTDDAIEMTFHYIFFQCFF